MSNDIFTIEELVAALTVAPDIEAVDGAYTVRQLREAMPHKSNKAIQDAIRAHIKAGRMESTRVPFERIDGIWAPVSAYRLVNHDE